MRTEVSDSSGAIVERYEYDVYGEVTIYDGSDTVLAASAIGNPYLFTGRRFDPESGNYYYRARVYSPELGRFLSMDPLGFDTGDYNLYRYVLNNTVNLTDPTGLVVDTVADIGFIVYDVYVIVDHLGDECADLVKDLLALGLDVVGAAVPFATGGGLIVRAGGKADNVVDAARIAQEVEEAGDKASIFVRFVREEHYLKIQETGKMPVRNFQSYATTVDELLSLGTTNPEKIADRLGIKSERAEYFVVFAREALDNAKGAKEVLVDEALLPLEIKWQLRWLDEVDLSGHIAELGKTIDDLEAFLRRSFGGSG